MRLRANTDSGNFTVDTFGTDDDRGSTNRFSEQSVDPDLDARMREFEAMRTTPQEDDPAAPAESLRINPDHITRLLSNQEYPEIEVRSQMPLLPPPGSDEAPCLSHCFLQEHMSPAQDAHASRTGDQNFDDDDPFANGGVIPDLR
eukprot:scaffold1806_cov240-Pinguiococcus_pyrenoidosus.AAC.22